MGEEEQAILDDIAEQQYEDMKFREKYKEEL